MAGNRKKPNAAKEWLSDNLRYILLLLLAAIIVLVIVVLYQSNRVTDTAEETTIDSSEITVEETAEATETPAATTTAAATKAATKTPTPTPTATTAPTTTPEAEEMTTADTEIASLVEGYMNCLGNNDGAALSQYVDNPTEEDIAAVNNGTGKKNYGNIVVYSANGPTEGSYVVLASYTYQYDGYDVDVPGLSQFYVYPKEDGTLTLASEITDSSVQEAIQNLLNSADVQAAQQEVQQNYDTVMNEHPDLQEYVNSIS